MQCYGFSIISLRVCCCGMVTTCSSYSELFFFSPPKKGTTGRWDCLKPFSFSRDHAFLCCSETGWYLDFFIFHFPPNNSKPMKMILCEGKPFFMEAWQPLAWQMITQNSRHHRCGRLRNGSDVFQIDLFVSEKKSN